MEDNEVEKQLLKEYGELCIRYMNLCRLIAEYEIGLHREEMDEEELKYMEQEKEGMQIYKDGLYDRLREIYLVDNPYETYLLIYGG